MLDNRYDSHKESNCYPVSGCGSNQLMAYDTSFRYFCNYSNQRFYAQPVTQDDINFIAPMQTLSPSMHPTISPTSSNPNTLCVNHIDCPTIPSKYFEQNIDDSNGTIQSSNNADLFINLTIFFGAYIVIFIGFLFFRRRQAGLKFTLPLRLTLLGLVILLETYDVITDIIQANTIINGAPCGVTTCIREKTDVGYAMIPWIIFGTIAAIISTFTFFRKAGMDSEDVDVVEYKLYDLVADSMKIWLENIPMIFCLMFWVTADDGKWSYISFTFLVTLIITAIDFYLLTIPFLFCRHDEKAVCCCYWIGCLTFTLIIGVLMLSALALNGIIYLGQDASQDSQTSISVNDQCTDRDIDIARWFVDTLSINDRVDDIFGKYDLYFEMNSDNELYPLIIGESNTDFKQNNGIVCDYTVFPELGSCIQWMISCEMEYTYFGNFTIAGFQYEADTLCSDLCSL